MTKSNRMLKVLKEELRSITALNFIAKSSNIVEKIFWATLAISGTLFIYDAVSSQLETWKSNPILKTQEKIELKDLPILDITFCHKAMLKYGPTERFLNDINPKVDEIPKEVLAIRNEKRCNLRSSRTNLVTVTFVIGYLTIMSFPRIATMTISS